jgi:hypothetical protein
VKGNTGGRGSPMVVAAGNWVGMVCGPRVVLEESSARSGNGQRRLPTARPS